MILNMPHLGLEQTCFRKCALISCSDSILHMFRVIDLLPYRMASEENSRWERRTWPELKRLTEEVPEAGIHFQSNNLLQAAHLRPIANS